jgi:hypothetical protein
MKYLFPLFVFLVTPLAYADYEKGCLRAFANFRAEMSSYYDLDEARKKYLEEESDEAARSAEKLANKSMDKAYKYGFILHECREQGLIK